MSKKFLGIFLFSLFASFSFGQNPDSLLLESAKISKKYKIGGVRIEGAENSDKNVIALIADLTVGETIAIPGDKITDAIKALWKQSLFESIEIYKEKVIGDDVFLVIKVVERPRLSKFAFKGDVRKSDADDIRGRIRLMKERVITDYMLGTIKNTVRDHYMDKGFYFAKVDIITEKDLTTKTPHIVLTIQVDKGKKVRIQDVNIEGNTVYKDWQLRRKLKESKRYRWYNFFNSGKYIEENLKSELPAIAEKYSSKGYRDA
ncbi:MAG: hypothetical protein JNM96_00105, partial [Bacteroidia bacterium]|nr:hypothetical protein [Bacteroidia bacterium]